MARRLRWVSWPLAGLGVAAAATTAGCAAGQAGGQRDASRPASSGAPARSGGAAPGMPAGAEAIRTANPYARGYTDADFPRIRELAAGVYSYEQLRSAGDEKFTTVSLFVVTDDGVLVADGQGNTSETQRLLDSIRRITSQPVTHVVIGSDHGDHTGGNDAFPANVTYHAHPTSAAILRASAERAGRAAPAFQLVEDRSVLRLGSREIHLLFLGRAHTGGDLSVYLPREKILFMSEAYLHRVFPAMRSAYPTEWVRAIERAQAMDVDIYVPGHGFVDSPHMLEAELGVFGNVLVSVIGEATRLHAAGVPVEQAITRANFGDLESWSLRSSQGAIAIRRVYAELNGELR